MCNLKSNFVYVSVLSLMLILFIILFTFLYKMWQRFSLGVNVIFLCKNLYLLFMSNNLLNFCSYLLIFFYVLHFVDPEFVFLFLRRCSKYVILTVFSDLGQENLYQNLQCFRNNTLKYTMHSRDQCPVRFSNLTWQTWR